MATTASPSPGEIRALAQRLHAWADELAGETAGPREMSAEDGQVLALAVAEAMQQVNSLRTLIFDMPFGNPNWDVMLDLFVREATGRCVTLDHLALEGENLAATVHRCVEVLAARGLIERLPDRFDAHVEWLSLSPTGRQAMTELLLRTASYFRPCGSGPGFPGVELQAPDVRRAS